MRSKDRGLKYKTFTIPRKNTKIVIQEGRLLSMLNPGIAAILLLFVLQWPPGTFAARNVTLESIEIFRTHEWFHERPTIYFRCQGENKTFLPDVKEKNNLYSFRGEESWQPLTALPERKCKRCGFYEEDKLTSDDTFDEWELCPGEFSPAPEGRYRHYKKNEFNATFLCPQCNASDSGTDKTTTDPESPSSADSNKRDKSKLAIVIWCMSFLAVLAMAVFLYKLWQRKKREEQAASFLRLFEEDDDLEIELGLKEEL